MRFFSFALLACAIVTANAHFQLAYPPPRGPFDDSNEVNFCDNYVDAVSNRSEFPISNGIVTLNSEHPQWTFGILLSTVQDPTSFDNFTNSTGGQQFARYYATGSGEGGFCIPLNLSASGISGVTNGANVTLQFVYNGGDGLLYQCADLTLSSTFTIPSNITCSNSSSTSTATTAGGTPTSTKGAGTKGIAVSGFASALAFVIALITA